ncbi:MAG TPA: 1-acyl-sn-glycerol-3-phosphate acyltransferase [Saprospiraceae bacterium]|jgi:glycerol-3-phosphate O-acyltransferase|nr:1-acyl-sn-glycerol-3-phosphate acyltransferase [Saprospiraceae bacterium]
MSSSSKIYQHVIPDIENWPIFRLSEDRRSFVAEVQEFTVQRLLEHGTPEVTDMLSKTVFQERVRIKEEPWKVDPPNERQFWRRIRKRLIQHSLDAPNEEATQNNEEILQLIVNRYAEEIVGTFRIGTFLFARRFLTLFFTRLLNTAAGGSLFGSKYRLQDRLLVTGRTEAVRGLFAKGTVVVVPTHFSNLDSILIGFAMDSFAGLPSFSYGAGLNLYNTGYTAYFMNRLGAYRVDRRKKNPIYLETLKSMSNLSIQRGTNSLFFPGGTRSRSGALETKLKMGLLGTVVEAQRALYEKGENTKIFVVPAILGYHFVLEAPYLIEQYLRQVGKERYIKSQDAFYSVTQLLKFTWQFFSQSSDINVSFGQPMDVLGNPVDAEGMSYDQHGNPIDVREYFLGGESVNEDLQRETEYTKILADRIVERYHKDNLVLSSHLVAFAAFQLLKRQNPRLDLYGILRLPVDEYIFSTEALTDVVGQLQQLLIELHTDGHIQLSDILYATPEEIIQHGIRHLGAYHVDKPLRYNKAGEIVSDSFNLLFFYHNRLSTYGWENHIQWRKRAMEEVAPGDD